MEPKIDEYFLAPLKSCKSAASWMSFTGNIRKRPFPFWLLSRGKCINQKKLNVKTMSRPCTKRTHQSFHLWVSLPFGYMLWTQTEESNSVFQTLPIIIIVRFMNDLWLNHQANILGTNQKYPFELICRDNEIKRCKCNQNIHKHEKHFCR